MLTHAWTGYCYIIQSTFLNESKKIIVVKSTLLSTGQILSQPNLAFSFLVHSCLSLRVLIFYMSLLQIVRSSDQ